MYKIEDFEFINGIFELCQHYTHLDYIIIVVTNQSGIAREYYSDEDFNTLTAWMLGMFAEHAIEVTHVYHCPHHPDISGNCDCRKPNPGMLIEAAKEFNIDLENSIIIGDKERDVMAGINAGLQETYLFDESSTCNTSKATKIISKLEDIYNVNTK